MSRPTYTRKIMAGTIFAGGRVSSFHLTSLARHSVRRPPRRFPRPLEGLDSLRWLQVGLSRPVNPKQVREPLGCHAQRLSCFFPPAATPGHLKAYLADGTFIVRTTAGEALAISIPRTEAGGDHLRSEILVKSPS